MSCIPSMTQPIGKDYIDLMKIGLMKRKKEKRKKYSSRKTLLLAVLGFIFLLLVPLVVSGTLIFKQGDYVNYRFKCLNETNSYCGSEILLVVSINYPNGTNALDNVSMTYNPTYFNITLPTSALGEYNAMIISLNINQTLNEFIYEVTYTGYRLSIQNVYLYMFGIIILVLFILTITYIIYRLPDNDSMDNEGIILKVSYLKHLRKVLWVVNWGLVLAIIFMIANILIAFLNDEMMGKLFFVIYQVLFIITMIAVPLYFIYIFVKIYEDKEMQKMINRGIDIKGTP